MKIRELLGEEGAQAVIRDYKPGQSLSMVDPATDTMTVVDLKKNPTAVSTDAEGNLVYDPTPEAGAATPGAAPQVPKPGDKVNIDMAAAEDMDPDMEDPSVEEPTDLPAVPPNDTELTTEPADEILRIRNLAGL